MFLEEGSRLAGGVTLDSVATWQAERLCPVAKSSSGPAPIIVLVEPLERLHSDPRRSLLRKE